MNSFITKLRSANLIFLRNIESITHFGLMKQREIARKKIQTNPDASNYYSFNY